MQGIGVLTFREGGSRASPGNYMGIEMIINRQVIAFEANVC